MKNGVSWWPLSRRLPSPSWPSWDIRTSGGPPLRKKSLLLRYRQTNRLHTVTLVAREVPLLPSRHPRLLERVVSACEASVAPVLLPLPNVGSRLRASGGGQVP